MQFTPSNHLFILLKKAAPSPRSRPRSSSRFPSPAATSEPPRRALWGSSKHYLLRISSSRHAGNVGPKISAMTTEHRGHLTAQRGEHLELRTMPLDSAELERIYHAKDDGRRSIQA